MMFTNLFFLILVLLIVNMASEARPNVLFSSIFTSSLVGLFCYFILLGTIVLQNKFLRFSKKIRGSFLLFITNFEVIAFLLFYHFILATHRLYYPLLGQTGLTIVTLLLYFGALTVFHYSTSSYEKMTAQIRFMVPFALPFLIFGFIGDIITLVPNDSLHDFLNHASSTVEGNLILLGFVILLLILLVMILPPLFIWIWGCTSLKDPLLEVELENVCKKAKFKHAGIKVWSVLNHIPTAAVIGVVPKLRYIIFTEALLRAAPSNELQAILSHEIGHNYRKHLLIYPFILFGMTISAALFFLFFGLAIQDFFESKWMVEPFSWWLSFYPIAILIPYVMIFAFYFRFVFGFFSRLFERQADLHVFHLGIPPEDLIHSLDRLGIITGNTHRHPSWHHFSIEQRIRCLKEAMANPQRVADHHRKVKWCLSVYFFFLAFFSLFLLLSVLPTPVSDWTTSKAHIISNYLRG